MQRPARAHDRLLLCWYCFVFFAVGFFLAGCSGKSNHSTWSNATGGEQHEQLIWKAIGGKDWTEVERHVSATFVGVSSEGEALDRDGWIAYWKGSQAKSFALGNVEVHPEGPDLKVVSILRVEGTAGRSAASPAGLRVISIWQEIKGHWVLTATSMTPIQTMER